MQRPQHHEAPSKPDLSFDEYLLEQERIDSRRNADPDCKQGRWTDNPLLHYGFFERNDRQKDTVSTECASVVRSACMNAKDETAKRDVFVKIFGGVRFTQGRRGAAQKLAEALCVSNEAWSKAIVNSACGAGVYRGVIPRSMVPQRLLKLCDFLRTKSCFDSVEELQSCIADVMKTHRRPFFHSAQLAFDLTHEPYRTGVCLRDGGRSCPLLVGSRRGLSYVNKFFPKDEPETIASLAKRLSRRPTVIQTTLCAYHKYVKVWNFGINRWYKPLRGKTGQCWAQRRRGPQSHGRQVTARVAREGYARSAGHERRA